MKRWWLLVALGVLVVLIGAGRTWVSGTVTDPVLGGTIVQASGTATGATLVAGGLLAGAALLAGLVGSRPVRLAASLCLAAAAVLVALPAGRALTSASDVVADAAADLPGAVTTGHSVSQVATTIWPWLGLVAALLILAGAAASLVVWSRGAGQRDERAARQQASRREPVRDDWDDLSRGYDPTIED